MKVKYIGSERIDMIYDKVYEVMAIEKEWYRLIDESEEDYLYPPEWFTIVSYENVPEDKYPEYRK